MGGRPRSAGHLPRGLGIEEDEMGLTGPSWTIKERMMIDFGAAHEELDSVGVKVNSLSTNKKEKRKKGGGRESAR